MKSVFILVLVLASITQAKKIEEKKTDRKPNQASVSGSKDVQLIKKGDSVSTVDIQNALVQLGKNYRGYTPKSAEIHCTLTNNEIEECHLSATTGYIKDQF